LETFADVIVEFAWYRESWLSNISDVQSPPVEAKPTVNEEVPELAA
jgi:hypothetical protein